MKAQSLYHVILLVYILLCSCQLIACHLTHSLIILTDSYINLYKILDISLGILHLSAAANSHTQTRSPRSSTKQTQSELAKSGPDETEPPVDCTRHKRPIAGRLFEASCTYQYRRLPLLGSFVNGIFLAALLMSAAIEGLQTCFHVRHSAGSSSTNILTKNVLTYPVVLAGFALVGLIMQYCSLKVHEMRGSELGSESLFDLVGGRKLASNSSCGKRAAHDESVTAISELNATNLARQHQRALEKASSKRQSYDLNLNSCAAGHERAIGASSNNQSLQELPLTIRRGELADSFSGSQISLKSLKISLKLDSIPTEPAKDLEGCCLQAASCKLQAKQLQKGSPSLWRDNWFLVRCLASPVALLTCSAFFYFVEIGLTTEVADAALAVTVVLLLFAASYPPMKSAGKILLQTVPEGVDLDKLRRELKESSCGAVADVADLHVWSLTPQSNRVATCRLVLDKSLVATQRQVEQIVREAKFKFLDQRIKCTTIEPELRQFQADRPTSSQQEK